MSDVLHFNGEGKKSIDRTIARRCDGFLSLSLDFPTFVNSHRWQRAVSWKRSHSAYLLGCIRLPAVKCVHRLLSALSPPEVQS